MLIGVRDQRRDVVYISLRDWLELGQAITDRSLMGPKYFRKHQTVRIRIGGRAIEADGKTFVPATYELCEGCGK